MNYETLETLMNSPEAIYTAIGITTATLGYVLGRFNSKNKVKLATLESDKFLASETTKQSQLESEKQKESNVPEIKKLDYENSTTVHTQKLELMAKEREYSLEDEERRITHEEEHLRKRLEDGEVVTERKLKLARELVELKPALEQYLEDLKTPPTSMNDDYLKQRADYQSELVDEILQNYRENDGVAYELIDNENDIMDADTTQRIKNIVNAKFSSPQETPQTPPEIKKLIDLITRD
jgi:hypothetical protein